MKVATNVNLLFVYISWKNEETILFQKYFELFKGIF